MVSHRLSPCRKPGLARGPRRAPCRQEGATLETGLWNWGLSLGSKNHYPPAPAGPREEAASAGLCWGKKPGASRVPPHCCSSVGTDYGNGTSVCICTQSPSTVSE